MIIYVLDDGETWTLSKPNAVAITQTRTQTRLIIQAQNQTKDQ